VHCLQRRKPAICAKQGAIQCAFVSELAAQFAIFLGVTRQMFMITSLSRIGKIGVGPVGGRGVGGHLAADRSKRGTTYPLTAPTAMTTHWQLPSTDMRLSCVRPGAGGPSAVRSCGGGGGAGFGASMR
jgi:hypothetical protein